MKTTALCITILVTVTGLFFFSCADPGTEIVQPGEWGAWSEWGAWGAWKNTGDATDYLDKAEIEAGDYGTVVDNAGNPADFDAEYEYKLQKQERTRTRTRAVNDGTETDTDRQTRWTKVSEWGEWVDTGVGSGIVDAAFIEGNFENVVDTDGNPFTPDDNYEYSLHKYERTHSVTGEKQIRWVVTYQNEIEHTSEWGEWVDAGVDSGIVSAAFIKGNYKNEDVVDTDGNLFTPDDNYEYNLHKYRRERTHSVTGEKETETRWVVTYQQEIEQTGEWGEWVDIDNTITGYLSMSEIESGSYDNIVDENGNPFTLDPNYKYQIKGQECTHSVTGEKKKQWRVTARQQIEQEQDLAMSDKTPGVADIDTVVELGRYSPSTGGGVVGMLDSDAANTIQAELLPGLSKQAAQLEAFFGDSAGSTFFTQMAGAQGAIKGQVANTTPAAYLDLVNGHADSAAETLFTTAEAKTLWAGYRAGHYLLTRDWQTVDSNIDQTKLDEYKAAYRAVKGTDPSGDYGAHTVAIPMGEMPKSALEDIEGALVTAGVAELSAQGITGTKAQDMVRALVRQFGQDNVEFQAFYDDLVEEDMSAVLNHNYNVTVGQVTAMAPIGQQSAKLASVDAEFPHDAIKYNYKTNTILMNNRKDGGRTV